MCVCVCVYDCSRARHCMRVYWHASVCDDNIASMTFVGPIVLFICWCKAINFIRIKKIRFHQKREKNKTKQKISCGWKVFRIDRLNECVIQFQMTYKKKKMKRKHRVCSLSCICIKYFFSSCSSSSSCFPSVSYQLVAKKKKTKKNISTNCANGIQ